MVQPVVVTQICVKKETHQIGEVIKLGKSAFTPVLFNPTPVFLLRNVFFCVWVTAHLNPDAAWRSKLWSTQKT